MFYSRAHYDQTVLSRELTPRRLVCYDAKARLQWRVTPHPLSPHNYVLLPKDGRLRVSGGVLVVP